MATEATSPRELEVERKQLEADSYNKSQSGVGVRRRVGQTRGKNPIVIQWDAFDDSKPDTLPKAIQEFMEVTSVKDEPTLVTFLIAGYNDAAYTAASDPLAEFVEDSWPSEAKTQFRLVVRGYARGLSDSGMTLEGAVALIKPGFVQQYGSDKQPK